MTNIELLFIQIQNEIPYESIEDGENYINKKQNCEEVKRDVASNNQINKELIFFFENIYNYTNGYNFHSI